MAICTERYSPHFEAVHPRDVALQFILGPYGQSQGRHDFSSASNVYSDASSAHPDSDRRSQSYGSMQHAPSGRLICAVPHLSVTL